MINGKSSHFIIIVSVFVVSWIIHIEDTTTSATYYIFNNKICINQNIYVIYEINVKILLSNYTKQIHKCTSLLILPVRRTQWPPLFTLATIPWPLLNPVHSSLSVGYCIPMNVVAPKASTLPLIMTGNELDQRLLYSVIWNT